MLPLHFASSKVVLHHRIAIKKLEIEYDKALDFIDYEDMEDDLDHACLVMVEYFATYPKLMQKFNN